MRVALFTTCLVDALFPEAGKATVRLLERLGQPVEFPLEQTCCGQMHANSGYFEVDLVRRYVDTFAPYDAVVVPSGSCAASIHDQHPMIARAAGDETLRGRCEEAASTVCAPSRANDSAIALPMPRLPPVTTTTFPSNSPIASIPALSLRPSE